MAEKQVTLLAAFLPYSRPPDGLVFTGFRENGRCRMTEYLMFVGRANGRVMLIFWGERPFSPLNIVGGRFATGFGEKTEVTYVAVYRLEEA
jgi:hypothetical protein